MSEDVRAGIEAAAKLVEAMDNPIRFGPPAGISIISATNAHIAAAIRALPSPAAEPEEPTEAMIEAGAQAIGEARRLRCGGYPFSGDDPQWNPWLLDEDRIGACAAYRAMRQVVLRNARPDAGGE